jgi:hypothetical protein
VQLTASSDANKPQTQARGINRALFYCVSRDFLENLPQGLREGENMDFAEAKKRYFVPHGFYHFTDTRNIPSIISNGGILSRREANRINVKIEAPGGNDWSMKADDRCGMDGYVHLCFRSNHPMEHLAKCDGRIQQSKFLNISADVLTIAGTMCTLDVSNKAGIVPVTIDQACKSIDFEVLYHQTDWKDPKIKARLQQASKYEILVPTKVPIGLISGY